MHQPTRERIARHVDSLRHDPTRLFAGLIDPATVEDALRREGVRWRDCVFTPCITLRTFLGQVLCPDHPCRAAVAWLIAALVARGEAPCLPETGPYCKARQRLPVGLLSRLTRRIGQILEDRADPDWLFKGRRVLLVDGTTVSMPDTEENRRAFPQSRTQEPGLGFPIARLAAVISLATGAVRDLAIGPYLGKQTGETALLRSPWDRLAAGDIAVGDRFFASYFGIAPLLGRGVDGVSRMHQCRKVDFRRGTRLGVLDHLVSWAKPSCPDWVDMQMDVLRCRSPEMVEKEVWAHLLGYNAVRSLMSDAAKERGEMPRHLSFKGALQTMRAFGESIRVSVGVRRSELLAERLRSIASHRVGDRPGRFEPREKKRRPKPHRLMTVRRREARKLLIQNA